MNYKFFSTNNIEIKDNLKKNSLNFKYLEKDF